MVIRRLIVVITGGILGFLALYFGAAMLLLCGGLAAVLAVFYVRTGRPSDIGWSLIGAGTVPTYFLARNVYDSVTDPAVSIGSDTYVLLGVAGTVLLVGVALVVILSRPRLNDSTPG